MRSLHSAQHIGPNFIEYFQIILFIALNNIVSYAVAAAAAAVSMNFIVLPSYKIRLIINFNFMNHASCKLRIPNNCYGFTQNGQPNFVFQQPINFKRTSHKYRIAYIVCLVFYEIVNDVLRIEDSFNVQADQESRYFGSSHFHLKLSWKMFCLFPKIFPNKTINVSW